ncbi:MAG TPA: iron-sulfur cluster repair di-iron protein [Bryobacteraceae bacterium]|nr:iron-sulfur cluster repair di-iron protein [Bryobacteraceae bacterium]
MKASMDHTVREIAIKHPASVRVFESLGIDYCCGGQRSLREACGRASVSPDEVLDRISAAEGENSTAAVDWAHANVAELTRHIIDDHHSYIRRESPRLISMCAKVVARQGASHPEVKSIQELCQALTDELSLHMMKEENLLFPYLARMEAALREGRPVPPAMFGSVEMPISRMLADHDDAGALTERIRSLSGGFAAPADACPTYRAFYQGLEDFERDLHQHVHLENNILFPRALEMERKEGAYACA